VKSAFAEEAVQRLQEHTFFIETFRSEQSLRALAGSERLKAYQEAFSLWRRLYDRPADDDLLTEASDWWREHCLYLDKDARGAFIGGLSALKERRHHLASETSDEDVVERLWRKFLTGPDAIFTGAGLPKLATTELPSA
jgi:hypothetical protein